MAELKISCEHCGQHIQCDDGYRGMRIDCPSCQKAIRVPAVKHPNFPWAAIGGIVLLVVMLCRHWDGVGHFFSSMGHNIGSLVPATFKQVNVDGTLYVKLNSGETVPLSMVKVAVYEESFISNKMAAINETIKNEIKDLPAKSKQGQLENEAKLMVVLDLKVLNLVNDEPIWGEAIATSETDKDGKFHVTLPNSGHYALFAVTSRRSLAGQERYIFFSREWLAQRGSTYTIDLNNQNEQIGQYAQYLTKDIIDETSDLDLLKDVLFWLMKGNYGLENVTPPKSNTIDDRTAAVESGILQAKLEGQARRELEKALMLPTETRKLKTINLVPLDKNTFKGTAIIEITATNSSASSTVSLDFSLKTQDGQKFDLQVEGLK
jgi:hypothetical protein